MKSRKFAHDEGASAGLLKCAKTQIPLFSESRETERNGHKVALKSMRITNPPLLLLESRRCRRLTLFKS